MLMSDKRAYFKLDVGYLTNPKVAAVSIKSANAVLLHVGSIGYAAQHLTDGIVPVPLLLRLVGATKRDAALLYQYGLWSRIDEEQADVHDFLEHQRSASAVKGATAHAKAAADARWNAERNAVSMPDAEQSASEVPMHRKEREEREERDKDIGSRKRAHQIPDTWRPNDNHVGFAAEKRLDLGREVAQFRDHHQAKGSAMKDWDAAFRTWLRNAEKWRGGESPPPARPSLPHASEIERPPDGLSPQEYDEWDTARRKRLAARR